MRIVKLIQLQLDPNYQNYPTIITKQFIGDKLEFSSHLISYTSENEALLTTKMIHTTVTVKMWNTHVLSFCSTCALE